VNGLINTQMYNSLNLVGAEHPPDRIIRSNISLTGGTDYAELKFGKHCFWTLLHIL